MFQHEDIKPLPAARGAGANAGTKLAIGMLARMAAVMLPGLLELLSKSEYAHVVFVPLSHCPIRSGRGYFVVLGNVPAGEADALLAARLTKKMHDDVQPVLVEAR